MSTKPPEGQKIPPIRPDKDFTDKSSVRQRPASEHGFIIKKGIPNIDLSPFTISEVKCGNCVLKFVNPLTLRPEFDDAGGVWTVTHDELKMHLYAESREELIDEVFREIAVLWEAYVEEDPKKLSGDALGLRESLKSILRKVD